MEPVAEADEKSWWSKYFGGSGYQRANSTHNAKPRKVRNRIIILIYKNILLKNIRNILLHLITYYILTTATTITSGASED